MDIVCHSNRPVGRVLVIHSWWGLTSSFRDYATRLAEQGYAVGLSDLFDGRTASDVMAAKQLRRAPRRVPMYKTLIADVGALSSHGDRGSQPVAVIGFSMGGHWAIWLSQRPELPVRSTVIYYSARSGSFLSSHSSFLAHFAETDPWVSKASRRNMAAAIAKAGRPYQDFDYPGAQHWFAELGRTLEYNEASATAAMLRTIAHLNSR